MDLLTNGTVRLARGKWHPDMLRPDADGYSFHRYFRYTHDGALKVICEPGTEERRKATKTEEVLKLNRPKLRLDRADVFNRYAKPRHYPMAKPCDPATADRIMARRAEQLRDVTTLPYREWYLTFPGNVCRCTTCAGEPG